MRRPLTAHPSASAVDWSSSSAGRGMIERLIRLIISIALIRGMSAADTPGLDRRGRGPTVQSKNSIENWRVNVSRSES